MTTKEIDYEEAYKDLSNRIDKMAKESAAICKTTRATEPMAKVFEEMKGFGDAVLIKHIK